VTFATLFAKTWRINKVLLGSGGALRKAIIRPQDVLAPMGVLLGLNLVILTTWTLIAPLTWERPILVDGKLGPYRGSCYYWHPDTDPTYKEKIVFATLLGAVNLVALLMMNYQVYRSRNLPSQYNESFYLSVTNLILFECVFAGVPILITTQGDSSTFVMTMCLIEGFSALGILIPMFAPKIVNLDVVTKGWSSLQRYFSSGGRTESSATDGDISVGGGKRTESKSKETGASSQVEVTGGAPTPVAIVSSSSLNVNSNRSMNGSSSSLRKSGVSKVVSRGVSSKGQKNVKISGVKGSLKKPAMNRPAGQAAAAANDEAIR
jgi:hypothetical protein